jgi:hypothetical protein
MFTLELPLTNCEFQCSHEEKHIERDLGSVKW